MKIKKQKSVTNNYEFRHRISDRSDAQEDERATQFPLKNPFPDRGLRGCFRSKPSHDFDSKFKGPELAVGDSKAVGIHIDPEGINSNGMQRPSSTRLIVDDEDADCYIVSMSDVISETYQMMGDKYSRYVSLHYFDSALTHMARRRHEWSDCENYASLITPPLPPTCYDSSFPSRSLSLDAKDLCTGKDLIHPDDHTKSSKLISYSDLSETVLRKNLPRHLRNHLNSIVQPDQRKIIKSLRLYVKEADSFANVLNGRLPRRHRSGRWDYNSKKDFYHKRSRRYELQTQLEDLGLVIEEQRDQLRFHNETEFKHAPNSTVDDRELMCLVLKLFAAGSKIRVQNYKSPLLFESYIRRHIFKSNNAVESSNRVYLFHIITVHNQSKCRGLVFLRSGVRGWNQRQKQRCKGFAESGQLLVETIVADRFQLMVFPGRWAPIKQLAKAQISVDTFSPLTKTYDMYFPRLANELRAPIKEASLNESASVETVPSQRSVLPAPVLSYDHLRNSSVSISIPRTEVQNPTKHLPPYPSQATSKPQGRQYHRTKMDELELGNWPTLDGNRKMRTTLARHNVMWQKSWPTKRQKRKGWTADNFDGASWAYDLSTRKVFSIKQEESAGWRFAVQAV